MTEKKREHLVQIGQAIVKGACLPAGYNVVVVVTDDEGEWCAVSSSDDTYTHALLTQALHGAELRLHNEDGSIKP